MKRVAVVIVLISAIMLTAFSVDAQVVYFEDFENGMPSGYMLIDSDGNTVFNDPSVSWVTDAWVAYFDFLDTANLAAYSTSWYDPADTSNDWMITTAIQLDSFTVLEWDAEAYASAYPDGYEVRIAATPDTTAFLFNPPLFAIANENAVRIRRRVDLAAMGYVNQTVYLAFRNNSVDQYLLLIDNIEVKQRPPSEVGMVALSIPATACLLSTSEDISVQVENFGTDTLFSIDVSYTVNGGSAPATVTETVSAVILPGDTFQYTFIQKADLSIPGTQYTVSATVTTPGDYFSNNNDSGQETVINILPHDASSEYVTSFETVPTLLGWVTIDNNNDGATWRLFRSSTQASSGELYFRYTYNPASSADDWLFSTCLDLEGGMVYRIKFNHKVAQAGGVVYDERMRVMLGTSQSPAGMSTLLTDLDNLVNLDYVEEVVVFTAPSTETFYIGFHCYSAADKYYLYLDDVTIEEYSLPEASFVTGVGTNPLTISFASTSTNADSLFWDFGDNSTSTQSPSVSHTYDASGIYTVCLTALNQLGADSVCQTVLVDTVITPGITAFNNIEIKIHPNPSRGMFILETEHSQAEAFIIVKDVFGREVWRQVMNSSRTTVDISRHPAGIYYITVQKGVSAVSKKVLKD